MSNGYALIKYIENVDHRGAVVGKGSQRILGIFATKEDAEEARRCLKETQHSKLWVTSVPSLTTVSDFVQNWRYSFSEYGAIKLKGRDEEGN